MPTTYTIDPTISPMASGSGKAKASSWAAAMGTVEALKDHHHHAGGVTCRWSHALRDIAQRSGSAAAGGSGSKSKPLHPAGGAAARRKEKQEQEEELRTVMYLSNWGPNN